MKLHSIKIKQYKVLNDFHIEFNSSKSTSIIIGRNGSGKTTFIECLTLIFSQLFRCQDLEEVQKCHFSFEFELQYLVRRETNVEMSFYGESYVDYIGVSISFTDNVVSLTLHYADESYETIEDIAKFLSTKGENIKYLFPDNMVLYYSGISDTLLKHFVETQEGIIADSLVGDSTVDTSYFYFQPQNFSAILIGLLSFQYGDVPDILREKFSINGFSEITILIKKPKWARPKSNAEDFWGARGNLGTFLSTLKTHSERVEVMDSSIMLTFQSAEQLQAVQESYGSEKMVFEYLVSLQANDLISNISLKLIKGDIEISSDRLSEGEKQLLTIIGLKELLAADNTLFLLDEPDTYLHPAWKTQFFDNLHFGVRTDLGIDEEYPDSNDQFIVTTHSAALISNLRAGNVFNMENGKIKLYTGKTFGKDFNTIAQNAMESDVRTPIVQKELEIINELIKNKYYSEAKQKLEKLSKFIGQEPHLIRLQSIIKRHEILGR